MRIKKIAERRTIWAVAIQVGLLFPPQEALEDDEHPWW